MRLIGKILVILIVGILLSASAYVIFYTGENTDNNNQVASDTEPPTITFVTGNVTTNAGQAVTILASFSDNVNVTQAMLYYKNAGSTSWTEVSILSGTASIPIPSSATSNYYYYVTVNDAAGNGPVGKPSADGSTYYIITVSPQNGGGGNENLTHTVLVEEATATWCTNCPTVANILHSLYESHQYNFYYVSLINDTNPIAANRNWNDYHVYGFPTVFIDGGYSVILGGNNAASDYENAISAAQERNDVPQIKVMVTAQYNNITKVVSVNTLVENRGNDTYHGRLKLYLTEIVSHWSGYDSKPYRYAFLDYLLDQNISVEGKHNATYSSQPTNISAYDYENLMIIGVVFSSIKNTGYANPRTNENPFDAYYADATNATKVVEKGNLPPQLQITSPQKGKLYLNGKPILEKIIQRQPKLKIMENMTLLEILLYNKTILLGKNKIITVDASDDSQVTKVEFYIDNQIQYNDTEAPYEWTFNKLSTFKSLFVKEHVLKVVVYDDTGKTNSASLIFKARI
jgi:hypothetical protein